MFLSISLYKLCLFGKSFGNKVGSANGDNMDPLYDVNFANECGCKYSDSYKLVGFEINIKGHYYYSWYKSHITNIWPVL